MSKVLTICVLGFQLEYLRHILVCLSGVPALWHIDCIQKMWKTVLQKPLTAGKSWWMSKTASGITGSCIVIQECCALWSGKNIFFFYTAMHGTTI